MNQQQFVDGVRKYVMDPAPSDVIEQLRQPAGRSPGKELLRLSSWYNSLSDGDRANLGEVAREVAHAAIFGLFCVFDGVRTIEAYSEAEFVLLHRTKDATIPLNGQGLEFLHDVLNADD